MKHCGNCANYIWGDGKTPMPVACVRCVVSHNPGERDTEPSNWKPKPMTNGDRIRAMSDEELADFIHQLRTNIAMCAMLRVEPMNMGLEWLQQPAEV